MTEPPPRLDAATARASQALIDAYAQAWQRIEDAQQALIDDPRNARKRARLNELQDMVSREIATLDEEARQYVQGAFPQVYAGAVARGANAVAAGQAAFVQVNAEAAARLATGLYTELLEATTHVDDTTKALVRRIGRDAALRTALEGNTAKQASAVMRGILREQGIHAVTYANGAKMGLKGYAEMAIRTSTALALNEGTLQGSADAGCLYWEIFDGPTCGWTYHDDPELANGKIVSRDDALAYPISHPNCRRAVGPRPDLGVDTAAQAQRSTTPEQDAAQLAQDVARGMPSVRDIARRTAGKPRRVPRAAPKRSEDRIRAAMARRDFPEQRKAKAAARRRPAQVTAPATRPAARRKPIDRVPDARSVATTDAQRDALDAYQNVGYRAINGYLRTGDVPPKHVAQTEARIAALDEVMAKSIVDAGPTLRVYRGAVRSAFDESYRLEGLEVGDALVDPGFLSTSTSRASALKFAETDYLFEVTVPQGTRAARLVGKQEDEVLLDRYTTLRVTGLSRDAAGRLLIRAVAEQGAP